MTSKPQIASLQLEDIPELSQFLISGFGDPADSTHFSHEVLRWKYFDGTGGPSEKSACSLVARSEGRIVGHIGICPRNLIVTGNNATPVSTMHAIDWLGSPVHFGSGTFLMLQALATCKTQYAVGGSAQAQAVFPRLGFEQKPSVTMFRKVLTPFHRLRSTGQGFFRKWAGTVKDTASFWKSRRPRVPCAIELRTVSQFTEEIDSLQRQSSMHILTCQRDHLLLNYFLRYPLPGFSGWTIHTSGRMIGYALLKITSDGRTQLGKIVDCWVATDDPLIWNATVSTLTDRLRDLSADTATCYATTPNHLAALLWNGYSKSGESNVYFRDKQQSLAQNLPLGFSMLEADHAIL